MYMNNTQEDAIVYITVIDQHYVIHSSSSQVSVVPRQDLHSHTYEV